MEKYETNSDEETRRLAKSLSKNIQSGVIALTGDLGAGKTTFVQGFAAGLGIKEKIISPTFVLIRQHDIPKTGKTLFHIDLYRLENISDIKNLGLEEVLSENQNIVLIEWAEKINDLLSKNTIKIHIEKLTEDKRLITVS